MSWAVIGGSGALALAGSFRPVEVPESRYGPASADVLAGEIGRQTVLFLARHGTPHRIAPHDINYRANIDVLRGLRVEGVIALNTVGGISASAVAGSLHLPDQIIDYTWGRAHTFSNAEELIHVDFADPFADDVRRRLRQAGDAAGVAVHHGGVYGATQGPRFESAAEIERMARDGCDLVGMTGMPEAALAREAGLPYAMLSLVVNPAAGRARDPFDLDAIAAVSAAGMKDVERLLRRFFAAVDLQGSEGR